MANSSYCSNEQKITRIDQALIRMGRGTLISIVLSGAVHQIFGSHQGFTGDALLRLWHHSLFTAILARIIAHRTRQAEPEQVFFAGLIHDLGRLVLGVNFPEAYGPLLDVTHLEIHRLLAEERKICTPHAEVGAWLLQRWNIDTFIVDAVLYHHEPAPRIAHSLPLVKIVFAG